MAEEERHVFWRYQCKKCSQLCCLVLFIIKLFFFTRSFSFPVLIPLSTARLARRQRRKAVLMTTGYGRQRGQKMIIARSEDVQRPSGEVFFFFFGPCRDPEWGKGAENKAGTVLNIGMCTSAQQLQSRAALINELAGSSLDKLRRDAPINQHDSSARRGLG